MNNVRQVSNAVVCNINPSILYNAPLPEQQDLIESCDTNTSRCQQFSYNE
jgi:hypothetical protein